MITDGITAFDTSYATTDGLAHDPECGGPNEDQIHNDVWYGYQATCTGLLTVRACEEMEIDTKIAIYDGTDCPGTAILACNDDDPTCEAFGSIAQVTVIQGNVYTVRVGGYDPSSAGEGTFTVVCDAVPANDECDGRITLACNDSATVNNCGATTGADDPAGACWTGSDHGSVYFEFVPTDTSARIRTDRSPGPSAVDSGFAVYAASQADICDETQWVELGCSEDEGEDFLGDICVAGLTPGNVYVIELVSWSASSCGEFTIDSECPCPPEPPDPERGYWGVQEAPSCQAGVKLCHDLDGGPGPGAATPCLTNVDCAILDPAHPFCWDDCWDDWRAANCIIHDHDTGAARCYIPKNRYLTIDPTVNVDPVAYHVTLTQLDDQYHDWCLPLVGWLSDPVCRNDFDGCPVSPQPPSTDPCQGAGQFGWVSYVVPGPVAPRVWNEYPLFVSCREVVPAGTYEIRVSTDAVVPLDPPLTIKTSHDPGGDAQHWGDVTSDPGTVLPWMPPEYATSFSDICACIKAFEGTGGPRLEWCDVEKDHVMTFGDVSFLIKAFEGDTYPMIVDIMGGCPTDPPPYFPRPLIGHEPCP
jgi:hypothetical protein